MKRRMLLFCLAMGAALAVLASAGGIFVYRFLSVRAPGHFFDRGGARMFYTDEGTGEVVVLLHGFAVNADLNWRRPGITERLAQEYRVVAMDLRGHGLSAKPHERYAYGPKLAEDVVALLDHLSIQRAHVCGYSLGGFVTLYLAAHYPERVKSAVLGGAGWEKFDPDRLGKLIENFGARLERGEGVTPPSGELHPDGPRPSLIHTAAVWTLTRYFNDGPALARVLQTAPQLEVSQEAASAIAVPLTLIVGTEDPLVRGVDALAEILPSVKIVRLEGGDHLSALRHPQFIPALLEALRAAGNPATKESSSPASLR